MSTHRMCNDMSTNSTIFVRYARYCICITYDMLICFHRQASWSWVATPPAHMLFLHAAHLLEAASHPHCANSPVAGSRVCKLVSGCNQYTSCCKGEIGALTTGCCTLRPCLPTHLQLPANIHPTSPHLSTCAAPESHSVPLGRACASCWETPSCHMRTPMRYEANSPWEELQGRHVWSPCKCPCHGLHTRRRAEAPHQRMPLPPCNISKLWYALSFGNMWYVPIHRIYIMPYADMQAIWACSG